MCDNDPKVNAGTEGGQPSYQPASFNRRVIAWVGVAYMVILVLSTTYMIATAQSLSGTAGLLLVPAAVGGGVILLRRFAQSKGALWLLLTAICCAAAVFGLWTSVPTLLEHLKGLFA